MKCRVTEQGTLADCSVVSEDPPGEGFGEAALKLSGGFRMEPKTADGQSVKGAVIVIPIRFTPR